MGQRFRNGKRNGLVLIKALFLDLGLLRFVNERHLAVAFFVVFMGNGEKRSFVIWKMWTTIYECFSLNEANVSEI